MNTAFRRQKVARMLRAYGREAQAKGTTINIGMSADEMADIIDPTCKVVFTDTSCWTDDGYEQDCDITCSACGHYMDGFDEALDSWQAGYAEKPLEYCPYCGARITGVE